MFNASPLYVANYESSADVVVNQGGSSSGKTYSIAQVLFTIAIRENAIITVAGQDIPNIKAGVLRDALDIVNKSEHLQSLIASYNKTDRVFEFRSGSILEFKSYSNAQDAKSGKRDYLFVNEANGITYEVYNELAIRTKKRVFIDYNPNTEFWVHNKVIGQTGSQLIISDHRHNPFCEPKIREKLEALKNVDEELWKVYARGLTGKIEGLIFRNWTLTDEIPKEAKFISSGLDFGFTNDPTAMLGVWTQNGELWVDEFIYDHGLTNPDIAKLVPGFKVPPGIVADSAEPKSIEELRRMNIRIEAAQKGTDSVKNSIDVLKRYKINITRRSVNLRKELNQYKWKVDKTTGKAINEPVDFMNHAIDALRYVALNKLAVSNTGKYTIL
jgi:phage terminase large subunit